MPKKKFKDLTLADDFLFGATMRHEEVCKPFLEKLLGKEIRHIEYIERQKDLSDTYNAHGIRLDVYLNDEQGTIYNVEMQNVKDDLPKRSRYYQSGIDRRTLESSKGYEALKESYVIFVCNYDHFKRGLAVYEKVSSLRGCEGIDYDDGSRVFILNSHYDRKNADKSVLRFLDCVRDGKYSANCEGDPLMQAVNEVVQAVKSDREMEEKYMTYAMKMADERKAGFAEGRAEGRAEGSVNAWISSVAALMRRQGINADVAMDILNIPEEVRQTVLAQLPQ